MRTAYNLTEVYDAVIIIIIYLWLTKVHKNDNNIL